MKGLKFKRLRLFQIDLVRQTRDTIFIGDSNDRIFSIPRNVEGNVPHDGIFEEGTIWIIQDLDGNTVRWKYNEPMFDGWDY